MSLLQPPTALLCPNCGRVFTQLVTTRAGEILGCDACARDHIGAGCTFSTTQWQAADTVEQVLTLYGLTPSAVSKVPTSPMQSQRAHVWLVTAGTQQYVLKRYHAWLLDDAIRYEHSILGHLKARQFPVAVPIQTTSGQSWITLDGQRWVLYPALGGAHFSPDDWNFKLGRSAEVLARMHVALKDFVPAGEPDPAWTAPTLAQINAAMDNWPALPELPAEVLAIVRERLENGYFALDASGNLPRTIVHGEFTTTNVLWEGETISGVLDFERAHHDTPLWDLATGAWTRFPPVLRAVVAMYDKAWPLSPEERGAIPDAILLGAVLGLDAQLTIYKQPAEVSRRAQDIVYVLRDTEQLRKVANAARH